MCKHSEVARFTVQFIDEDGDKCRETFTSRDQAVIWLQMLRSLVRSGGRITDIRLISF